MTTHSNDTGNQRATDELYMRRCIQLARNGMAGAPPNPMVGAVIVADGHIIGEGWHRRCGGPHAEVNAIASVAPADVPHLCEATMYVSLEPCSHWGRTPPCAELLVEKKLRRVVVGCEDPFAQVSGRGIERLRQAGIEVEVGVLRQECVRLNQRFITFHTQQRPWITLKWAESADGYIDRQRTSRADGEPVRFSDAWTQTLVHRLRATHQAIVVGRRTWELDAPALTTRLWPGPSPQPFILSTTMVPHEGAGPEVFADVRQLLAELHRRGLQALLVEGGAATLQTFIDADLWDEAYVEHTDIRLGAGVAAPRLNSDTKGRPLHVNFA